MSEAKKTEKPAAVEAPKPVPFEHGNAPVYILVPVDMSDQRLCLEYLEDAITLVEREPIVRPEMPLGKLRPDGFLYVVHPIASREKNEKGVFEYVGRIHVSQPIRVSEYTTTGDIDSLGQAGIDVLRLRTAVQAACDNVRAGVPVPTRTGHSTSSKASYRAQLSGDPDIARQTVKLFNS